MRRERVTRGFCVDTAIWSDEATAPALERLVDHLCICHMPMAIEVDPEVRLQAVCVELTHAIKITVARAAVARTGHKAGHALPVRGTRDAPRPHTVHCGVGAGLCRGDEHGGYREQRAQLDQLLHEDEEARRLHFHVVIDGVVLAVLDSGRRRKDSSR